MAVNSLALQPNVYSDGHVSIVFLTNIGKPRAIHGQFPVCRAAGSVLRQNGSIAAYSHFIPNIGIGTYRAKMTMVWFRVNIYNLLKFHEENLVHIRRKREMKLAAVSGVKSGAFYFGDTALRVALYRNAYIPVTQ